MHHASIITLAQTHMAKPYHWHTKTTRYKVLEIAQVSRCSSVAEFWILVALHEQGT